MTNNKIHQKINSLLQTWQDYLSKLSMADSYASDRLFTIETRWESYDLTKEVAGSEESCTYTISHNGRLTKVGHRLADTYQEALTEMVNLILDVMNKRLEIVKKKPAEQLEEADYFVINKFRQVIKDNFYD